MSCQPCQRIVALVLWPSLSACGPAEPDAPGSAEPVQVASEPTPEVDAPAPEPAADAESDSALPAVAPPFDPLTVVVIEARIVGFDGKHWHACGVIHSVGAIEVEVLGVGEPPPNMVLYVSCPADFGHRALLVEGNRVHVRLHARKQSWPRPAAKLDPALPVRYVKSMRPVVGG